MGSWPVHGPGRIHVVGGYRFFQLNESLSIISRSSLGLPPFPDRPNITVFDYFSTSNNFNGGDVGLAGEYRFRSRFWFGGEGRLAMGNMQETLKIDGVTTAAASGFTATLPNGLLAQPTNIGTFTQNHFALIPSVDLKVGYHLTPGFRLTVGYNFTYITRSATTRRTGRYEREHVADRGAAAGWAGASPGAVRSGEPVAARGHGRIRFVVLAEPVSRAWLPRRERIAVDNQWPLSALPPGWSFGPAASPNRTRCDTPSFERGLHAALLARTRGKPGGQKGNSGWHFP